MFLRALQKRIKADFLKDGLDFQNLELLLPKDFSFGKP
jgi:hypothetical protein